MVKKVKCMTVLVRRNLTNEQVTDELKEHSVNLLEFSKSNGLEIESIYCFKSSMVNLVNYKTIDTGDFIKSLDFNDSVFMFTPFFLHLFDCSAIQKLCLKKINLIFAFYHNENKELTIKEMSANEYHRLKRKNSLPRLCYFPVSLVPEGSDIDVQQVL